MIRRAFHRARRTTTNRRIARERGLDPMERAIALALFARTYPPDEFGAPHEYGAPGYRACLDEIENDARTAAAAARRYLGVGWES